LTGVAIVVVEDDEDSCVMLATLLTLYGARVSTAGSAYEGLETVSRVLPDLLISDISMPGEDGLSLIRKIRALGDGYASVPAIALTGRTGYEHREIAKKAGFDEHVAKPVEFDELVGAIQRLLGDG
jgi:CheY-like chemotaxis protein